MLQTDVVKKVQAVLEKHDAYGNVYYGMREHSPIADIRDALKLFKESGADVIVSVGGGSPIDASKAILYNLHKETGQPLLRQIAIPTTLSAAEYTVSLFPFPLLLGLGESNTTLDRYTQDTRTTMA